VIRVADLLARFHINEHRHCWLAGTHLARTQPFSERF
jgi:hypothetical protein